MVFPLNQELDAFNSSTPSNDHSLPQLSRTRDSIGFCRLYRIFDEFASARDALCQNELRHTPGAFDAHSAQGRSPRARQDFSNGC